MNITFYSEYREDTNDWAVFMKVGEDRAWMLTTSEEVIDIEEVANIAMKAVQIWNNRSKPINYLNKVVIK